MDGRTSGKYPFENSSRLLRTFCVVTALSLAAAMAEAPAMAGTYYCTPSGAGARNGVSPAHAWSLAEALSRAKAGDVVLLQSGTYGHFNYTRSNADWITWRADEGQEVVFADGATFGGYGSSATFRCRFEGITFHPNRVSTASGGVRHAAVWGTGATVQATRGPGYLQFVDCIITKLPDNRSANGIYLFNMSDVTVENCTVTAGVYPHHLGNAVYIRQTVQAADIVTNIRVAGCEISNCDTGVTLAGTTDSVIAGNHIYNCYADGIIIHDGFHNGQIIDNEVHQIGNEPGGTDHCDCLQMQESNDLHPDGSNKSPWANILIARNRMYDSERQIIHWGGLEPYPPTNVVVRDNIFYNEDRWTFEIRDMRGGSLSFVHNTAVGLLRVQTCDNLQFLNNIVYNPILDRTPDSVVSGNVFVKGSLPGGNIPVSDAQFWRMFENPAEHDYRLRPDAVAIDRCPVLPEAQNGTERVDMPGTGNEGTNYADAGALEYTGGPGGNRPPVLAAIGNKQAETGVMVTFDVNATDVDGDPVTVSAGDLPAGATFSNGTFAWTPTEIGIYRVTFTASDGKAQDSEVVTIAVDRPNRAPELAAIGDHATRENERLTFSVAAADADGDPLSYSLSNAPAGATLVGQVFAWTPTFDQAGSYELTFLADDGRTQTSETVTIAVANVNRPPDLGQIGDRSVDENNTLSFSLSAVDPDGDLLTYSAVGLPIGATLTGQTFTWTPASNQAGPHEISFTATDGESSASESVTLMVVRTLLDDTAPTVARCAPEPDAIQVPVNNLVSLYLSDAGTGVDADSVVIAVDGSAVYQGNVETYTSASGQCSRSGTKNDYRFLYQADRLFDFDHAVTVTVSAADLAGNVMNGHAYTFTTEMRAFGGNVEVSGTATSPDSRRPVTACDAAGNLWVAWHAGPENARDVYVAKRPADKEVFDTPIRLTNDPADQCNPDIAAAGNGSVYVAWQSNEYGPWDLFCSVCPDGRKFVRANRLTDLPGNETNPALAAGGPSINRVYVAWQDDRNDHQDIYLADSDTAFVTSTISRVTSDPAEQVKPDVAVDAEGAVYVIWTDMRNGQADIYGAASGAGAWANVPLVTGAADQTDGVIAVEPGTSLLHLAWVDNRAGDEDVYYAWSNGLPAGPVAGLSVVDDTSGAAQSHPSVACSGSQVFACWQDGRNIGTYGADTDLYFVELSPPAARTNILVGDGGTNGSQTEPAVGVDAHGQPYVVWVDNRRAATEIYYAGATFIDPAPLYAMRVVASAGATIGTAPGAIRQPGDVSIVVPPGACQADVRITLSRVVNPQVSPIDCLGSYDFGPSGIDFAQPVTVTIPYRYAGSGRAHAFWYDSLTGALSQQGITDVETIVVSPSLHALRFKTTHFTPYYLVSGDSGGGSFGGGGCSLSPTGDGSPGQLLIPYGIIAVVMAILRRRDRRRTRSLMSY